MRYNIIWLVIMIPCSLLFTGLGIYAMKRKKPMWFWSGSTVKEWEITDVPAYNKANGIMWLAFSVLFWISTVLGAFSMTAGGILLIAVCVLCMPLLPLVYNRIYRKYKR